MFVEGLYVKLVSVSRRCDPVAPSTKVRYTVSLVVLLPRISALVAKFALEIVPLIKFVEGLYVKLVSVSRRCDPVAPSTKVDIQFHQ